MKKIKLPYKLLTYDIETKLKQFYGFALGEQVVRHNQMTERSIHQHNIICIAAKWYDSDKVMLFKGDSAVEDFDKVARKADVCLGKNNKRFDIKYINTERMMRGLPPYPEWMDSAEDLESQMRKYFNFPSQSLDYISKVFGDGGKVKMEFDDWKDIHNYELLLDVDKGVDLDLEQLDNLSGVLFRQHTRTILKKGKAALKKMYFYNKKDVLDTEAALVKVLPYIKLRYNASNDTGCTTCGSTKIIPTSTSIQGKTRYQHFDCLHHNGYAGKAIYRYDKNRHKVYGKMG